MELSGRRPAWKILVLEKGRSNSPVSFSVVLSRKVGLSLFPFLLLFIGKQFLFRIMLVLSC